MLTVVTAVSRLNNLPTILASMEESNCDVNLDVCWLMIVDAPISIPNYIDDALRSSCGIKIRMVTFSGGSSRFGIKQKNYGIDLIEDGFVYILDDDNIVHPGLFCEMKEAFGRCDKKKAFVFNQQRWDIHGLLRAKHENMRPCHIDNSQFVVHRKLIGDLRYDLTKAGIEDFLFFREIYDKYPEEFEFIDRTLAFYNYLIHFPGELL